MGLYLNEPEVKQTWLQKYKYLLILIALAIILSILYWTRNRETSFGIMNPPTSLYPQIINDPYSDYQNKVYIPN